MPESMLVPLTQGFFAIVDAADYGRVEAAGSWHIRKTKYTVYARRNLPGLDDRRATLYMHTFLTGWAEVDHRNGDGLDNRRQNLREATRTQNEANKELRRDNTSGYKGVRLHRGHWRAEIGGHRTRRHLGYFDTPEEAAHAYDIAAVQLFGEFARLNFPEEDLR